MWIVLVIILIGVGLTQVIFPRVGWWMSNFWRFRGDAEPSDFSLVMYRLQGVGFILGAGIVAWLANR